VQQGEREQGRGPHRHRGKGRRGRGRGAASGPGTTRRWCRPRTPSRPPFMASRLLLEPDLLQRQTRGRCRSCSRAGVQVGAQGAAENMRGSWGMMDSERRSFSRGMGRDVRAVVHHAARASSNMRYRASEERGLARARPAANRRSMGDSTTHPNTGCRPVSPHATALPEPLLQQEVQGEQPRVLEAGVQRRLCLRRTFRRRQSSPGA